MTCEACKTIPPVIAEGYENKGSWGEVAGLKTCPPSATKALVALYDIFGPAPQTLQGADALSAALGALVLVPDFFKGVKMEFSWYADDLSEEIKALKEAFSKLALDFSGFVPALKDVVAEGKGRWEGVEAWGAYGLCWGGKVVALSSGPGTPFKASGQVHPGRLATSDAHQITIPHIVLASDGEDASIVQEYKDVLVGAGKPGVVDTYKGMHHGLPTLPIYSYLPTSEFQFNLVVSALLLSFGSSILKKRREEKSSVQIG
ncbi:putative AIM2 family protein [Lachnellula hyalina]|uniref:Putative AIM2 family protein n=1 Tax=Lachnellula hyalina TaxID=1316788 RepID=A0A8H8TZA2_9HELO|nr:putative AIM2 family protein [Lachnellula hyalina]TVY28089.1 putative AIM2 family protein [Lachnellula hyalina]